VTWVSHVDGTNFLISEHGWQQSSFKFKKLVLRYKYNVGLFTSGGEICWISGQYQPGDYNDLDIVWVLASHLDEFERGETDDCYFGRLLNLSNVRLV
jgi:hypothetical protein